MPAGVFYGVQVQMLLSQVDNASCFSYHASPQITELMLNVIHNFTAKDDVNNQCDKPALLNATSQH